nr:aminodeoxychorismate synthase component I [Arthrobacter roseus]
MLIAIDGLSGAGKTTLTVELAVLLRAHFSVNVFHLEDIYPGWDGLRPGMERYVSDVLAPLHTGQVAAWRTWDWEAGDDGPLRYTEPSDVVLLEGVGAACSAARSLLDAVIWIDAAEDLRCRMALARDGDAYAPFWDRWAEQEEQWLSADDVTADADVVVKGHQGPGTPALVVEALLELPALAGRLSHVPRPALSVRVEKLPARNNASALFAALYAESDHTVWLDSSNTHELNDRNRFSILADDGGPHGRTARHDGGTTVLAGGPVTVRIREPFFRWLNAVWAGAPVETPPDYPCGFTLGWLGYLGYELKRESGGADRAGPARTPDASLIFAGRAVVLDHLADVAYLLTLSDGRPDDDTEVWLNCARSAVLRAAETFDDNLPVPECGDFTVRDTREDYLAKILSAQNEIRAGNSYEVCLTTELTAHADRLEPVQVYSSLRRGSPAPFANYLRFGDLHLAGSSPERFLSITAEGALRAEPIKGTRPRLAHPEADAALRHELERSPKDRAENIMIVDLLRNDLSHFAVPGTVAVSRLCAVESYTTVHQMVSTIDAQLRPDASRAEAIAAAFPAGSMTGAPKISTMEILDRLETGPRGPYSGAVGYFSLTGAVELSVVIRTLVMHRVDAGFDLSLGVGGAITADSVPGDEWDEVRTKAHGVLTALGKQFPADT